MRKIITAAILTGVLLVTAQAAPKQPKLTQAQAQAVALKKEAGKVAGKPTLVENKGAQEYVFEVDTKAGKKEVRVDANTGKIVSDMAKK